MFRRKPKEEIHPEWLIVGLGNPGPEYRGTRHNVGFEVIERLADRNRIKMDRSKHRALIGTGKIAGVAVMLVKPLTYMNCSGQAIEPLARSHSLKPDRVLVIADDLDLILGQLRLKEKGSSGGHNGHKSVIAALRSQDYPRLKIGIGSASNRATIDHVLSKFDRDELQVVSDAIDGSVEVVEEQVRHGRAAALEVLTRLKQKPESEDSP